MNARLGHDSESGWRLGSALLVAVLLHAVVMASVQFQFKDVPPVEVRQLTVAFSQLSNQQSPDDTAPAAAADHQGGGMSEQNPPEAAESEPVAPEPTRAASAETAEVGANAPAAATAKSSTTVVSRQVPTKASETTPEPETHRTAPPKPALSASDLMTQARRLAKLSSSMPMALERNDRSADRDAGVSTRFSVRAAYVEGWVRKVEEWGTRNFPDRARRQNITGSLTLNVVLRQDGSIHEIKLLRSSGHEILDDAAFRIVRLAAPFAPFPKELRQQEGEFLTITRTWQFLQGDRLRSG